ncbi:MAG: hypothetical protein A4E19_21165 [Nitrospira sp. SG-bin1]|nr:MAG: hypothetical protein A4E19_21165 [Nitrospira sp. SG-bin1]
MGTIRPRLLALKLHLAHSIVPAMTAIAITTKNTVGMDLHLLPYVLSSSNMKSALEDDEVFFIFSMLFRP